MASPATQSVLVPSKFTSYYLERYHQILLLLLQKIKTRQQILLLLLTHGREHQPVSYVVQAEFNVYCCDCSC